MSFYKIKVTARNKKKHFRAPIFGVYNRSQKDLFYETISNVEVKKSTNNELNYINELANLFRNLNL